MLECDTSDWSADVDDDVPFCEFACLYDLKNLDQVFDVRSGEMVSRAELNRRERERLLAELRDATLNDAEIYAYQRAKVMPFSKALGNNWPSRREQQESVKAESHTNSSVSVKKEKKGKKDVTGSQQNPKVPATNEVNEDGKASSKPKNNSRRGSSPRGDDPAKES